MYRILNNHHNIIRVVVTSYGYLCMSCVCVWGGVCVCVGVCVCQEHIGSTFYHISSTSYRTVTYSHHAICIRSPALM